MKKKNKNRKRINKIEELSRLPQQRSRIWEFIEETAELLEILLIPLMIILLFAADGFSIYWLFQVAQYGIQGFWEIVWTIASVIVLVFSSALFVKVLNS